VEIGQGGNSSYFAEFVVPPERGNAPRAYTVNCVACSTGGTCLAAGSSDGRVAIYRVDLEGKKHVFPGPANMAVTALAFAPDPCPYIAVAYGYDWAEGAEKMAGTPDRFRPQVIVRPIPEDKEFKY
jgi:WD40 repeat protein